MQGPQRRIAIADALDDYAEGDDVGKLTQIEVLGLHLLPDRIGRLDPAVDLNVAQARLFHVPAQLLDDIDGHGVPGLAQKGRPLHDRLTRFGHEFEKGQILQLFLQVDHADPRGQRGVNLKRLRSNARPPLIAGDEVKGAHVVQSVGQLDQQHPDVARERQQQLAEILRLFELAAGIFETGELSNALDQLTHGGAEAFADIPVGRVGVFDHVVQQRGGDGGRIKPLFGEVSRHAHRVGEVGIARRPGLGGVLELGVIVGSGDHRGIEFGMRVLHPADQLGLGRRSEALFRNAGFGSGHGRRGLNRG